MNAGCGECVFYGMGEARGTGAGSGVRWPRRAAQVALLVVGVAVAVLVLWVLGPGAKWWLVHVDGVKVGGKAGLAGKDLADALDTVRGRAMAIATGLLAAVAIYYTAANAASARRSAQAAIEGVEAARLSAEATERAQLRTFELTQEGQRQSEEAQRRTHELTEHGQRTDRFTAAVAQLGDPSPAIQLGGVHALAGLADDSPTREFRQTCIDVLCAFLRLPYDPDPGDTIAEGQDPAEHARARARFRAIREVRHTVIRIIGNHLRDDATVSWQGHDLDFTDVVFDGGDFGQAVFTNGRVSFRSARFIDGLVNFSGARFEGGTADFINAQFEGRGVYFNRARFEGDSVLFSYACFRGGAVDFSLARFTGDMIDFSNARFGEATVEFGGAEFAGGIVRFDRATGRRPSGLPDGMADHLS